MGKLILTVSGLNEYAANLMRRDFVLRDVKVSGELSDVKWHTSGHLYFTLKDESALIRCVMFSRDAELSFVPQNGMHVIASGHVSLYVQGGQYQLYVKDIEQQGIGELFVRFNKLKEKLESEGLFDSSHKKRLPRLPKAIGVITSETGAVIKDIIDVTTRRFPTMPIYLYPVKVQGIGAAEEIAEGIRVMDSMKLADVLIVGRGGGSMEDLFAFNEEIVARAIYECSIPVVSAVGHETDFSIADYVADMRAPTPSAAAEICVPVLEELYMKLDDLIEDIKNSVSNKLKQERRSNELMMRSYLFKRVHAMVGGEKRRLAGLLKERTLHMEHKLNAERLRQEAVFKALGALSPYFALKRGYAIIKHGEKYVSSADMIENGDNLNIIMYDGVINATACGKETYDGE
ncbi:MAG: exodeoxyribonuclease VII large subunit [Clostridia bacterium]|nr:exodeoxyribonuclease VII large subunit [Clostridia bacterium]